MRASAICLLHLLPFILVYPSIIHTVFAAKHTLTTGQMIRDGETMVSADDVFELGFFGTGIQSKRYVGLWYKAIKDRKILWVANREVPVTSMLGALKVIDPGVLVVLNETNGTVWSSETSRSVRNPLAQLLNSGNLVVRDAGDDRQENFLWQSFEHPTDTGIPGSMFGWNLVTGVETYYVAWKSPDDPAPGEYSYHVDKTGYPQIVMRRKGSEIMSRFGPWNGVRFSGGPNEMGNPMYKLRLEMNEKHISFWQENLDKSFVTIFLLNQSRKAQRWNWIEYDQNWLEVIDFPADMCDQYDPCGAYGHCSMASSPICTCLDKFEPKDPHGWVRSDYKNGCTRRTNLSCQGDIFLKYSGIKLPDARKTWNIVSMTMKQCREECLKNCTCMAYTQLDEKTGSGCLFWYDDLIDIRSLVSDGQDIYVRMASTEMENSVDSANKKRSTILIASLASVLGVFLIGLSLFIHVRRSNDAKIATQGKYHGARDKDSDVPLFHLCVILEATNNFSVDNKIGEGGFGSVYKGTLKDGQQIAVKRLSKDSTQGFEEFKNEIISVAKLQHRNLVRLLGGCIQREESMLIYEYMPNKSLDMILFDQTKSTLLDWKRRFHIINGIARGLLYLHQDSRLRIIHRDLKASNILLDTDMNPKISDFGMAKCFGGNETGAKTRRVVGTYGYMSPEYAIDGLFSVKSDVFSFGVLVLEIVTGMRNRGFFNSDHNLNLLGHAWTHYKEGRSLELIDPCLNGSFYFSEILSVIHVGLLCVQQKPEDRPNMSTVVLLLNNEGVFPEAKQPGFFIEREGFAAQSSIITNSSNSKNEVTITMTEPR